MQVKSAACMEENAARTPKYDAELLDLTGN
jgi:hypothetical protein